MLDVFFLYVMVKQSTTHVRQCVACGRVFCVLSDIDAFIYTTSNISIKC